MPISLLRIDDRLIHGQVVEGWLPELGATEVVVFNEEAARNETQQALMKLALPENVSLEVVGEAGLSGAMRRAGEGKEKILILVASPADALSALEAGAQVSSVNVGGMHHSAGKVLLGKAIFLDDGDKEALRRIRDRGVGLDGRAVPNEASLDFEGCF